MDQYLNVEIALDTNKQNYKENKELLLTRLPTISEEDWYSFHDTERKQRKIIYKEIFCIRLPTVDTTIKLISLVKRVNGIYVECIYTNNRLIYASNTYSKHMNKDKIKELNNRKKTSEEKLIIQTIQKAVGSSKS
mgnify:CR=1 FL=1|tara:strand:- start:52 stop:456 length:405 start_codon:yes stop_codon:yes gene_type:complete